MSDAEPETNVFETAGDTGLRHSGGQLFEESAPFLRGRKGPETFQKMADSPLCGAVLLLIELLARQIDWKAVPSIVGDPTAEHEAEKLRETIDDMDTDFRQVVGEHVPSSVTFGWARSEMCFKLRRGPDADFEEMRSKHNDGRWGLRDLSPRAQDSLDHWIFDKRNRVVGMVQTIRGGQGGTYRVPESKMLACIPRPYKRSPEGRSMFRPGARPWTYAQKIEDDEAIGLGKDLTGVVVQELPTKIMNGQAPDAQSIRTSYENKIRKMKTGEGVGMLVAAESEAGLTTGYKTRLLASGGTGRINPDTAIRRHESRLLISLLCEFLLLGIDGVGARAVADPKINLVNLAIGAIVDVFADAFNKRVVANLWRLNGVDPKYWPKLEHGPIDGPDLPELIDMLTKLVGGGLLLPTDQIQRWVLGQIPGAPQPDPIATPNASGAGDEEDLSIAEVPPATMTMDQLANLVGAPAVKRVLGVGDVGLRALIAEGKLAAYNVRGRWKFDPAAVAACLQSMAHVVPTADPDVDEDEEEQVKRLKRMMPRVQMPPPGARRVAVRQAASVG